ncbi:MAG TPA: DUF5103 domain-containing protein [Flavobacteriales bacterium]|nr:DUF5103 domain-containing protein [Flavobacteriales bacterium]
MRFYNFFMLLILGSFLLSACFSQKEIISKNLSENDSIFTEEIVIIEPTIIYKNETFNRQIKTVLCHNTIDELSLPIINLNSAEQLLISFDDLDTDIKDYYFTIIHCKSDWTASDLMQSEYIDGFTDEPITNYEFSFNTLQKYSHYSFNFPTEELKPLLSGNYVFKIYEQGGETIAFKRFMVLETMLTIKAEVRRATLVDDRKTKHEIDFIIKHPNITIADPFSDIKVTIKQNNRGDNAITDLKPLFVKNNELIYDYQEDNTFWGNNEFRHFDIKSLRYQSERIKEIIFDSTYHHVYLFNDRKRPFDRYSIEPDINGKFLIKSQEGWKSSIEADYAFVHFTLPVDHISYGELYVIGEFTNWQLEAANKLKYNADKMQYEASIYLKQGYYNYHYSLKDTTTNRVDVSFIEGTHYQTRNDYYIYVYYRAVGDRYDRFVGFLKTSSKELF